MNQAHNKSGLKLFYIGFFLQAIVFVVQILSMVWVFASIRDMGSERISSSLYMITLTMSWGMSIVGVVLMVMGLRRYAKDKGRNLGWGWMGLVGMLGFPFGVIGAIILRCLKDLTVPVWHYRYQNQNVGPVLCEDIESLIKQGVITHDTFVWQFGQKEWHPARFAFPEYFRSLPPPPPQIHAAPGMPQSPPGAHSLNLPSYSPPFDGNTLRNTAQATLSLIFGILGIFPFLCILTIPGIIIGHIALNKANVFPDKYGGKSMAKWGMGLSYFSLVVYFVGGMIIGVLKIQLNNALRQL